MFPRNILVGSALGALVSLGGLGTSISEPWPTPNRSLSGPYQPKARKYRRYGCTKKSSAGAYKGSKRAKRATWGGGNPARY